MAVELKERHTDENIDSAPPLSMWYLYDGYIIATHRKLQMALEYLLSDEVKMSGLHLNLSKCEIWSDHEPSDDIKEAYRSEESQQYKDGTIVPNAPVGSGNFMEDSIVQKVNALKPLFEEVSALGKKHVSFTLLKFCLRVCEVNYLVRVTPVQGTKSGAELFDELVEKSLRHIVGGVLDIDIFRELQLPTDVKANCQNPTLGLGFLLPPPQPLLRSYLLRRLATPQLGMHSAEAPNELSTYLVTMKRCLYSRDQCSTDLLTWTNLEFW